MKVVSNTSPLIVFARSGHLDLLQAALGEVLVPPTVWAEATRAGRPGASLIADLPWVQVAVPGDVPGPAGADDLGLGERDGMPSGSP